MYHLRRATLSDATAMAEVNVLTWQSMFRGIVPDAFLDSLSVERRTGSYTRRFESDAYAAVVAETQAGRIIGYADIGSPRAAPFPCDAELYSLYVLPAHHRQGLGRRLFDDSHAACRSVRTLLVRALKANPHRGFYEHIGCLPITQSTLHLGGVSFPEIAYRYEAPQC